MCGIAGYFSYNGKRPVQTAVAIALLAREMESRGNHSWGCTDGENIQREMGAISASFEVPYPLPQNFALHTRLATQGKIKQTNSHPFFVNRDIRVVGMHNGMIHNHYTLNRKYERTCRVDSQHIFEHLAEKRELSDLEGYGTIVYKAGNSWHLGTFNNGDLAVARTPAGIFFASTKAALDRSLRSAGLLWEDTVTVTTKDNAVYRVEGDQLVFESDLDIKRTLYSYADDWRTRGGSSDFTHFRAGWGHQGWQASSGEEDQCLACGFPSYTGDGIHCGFCLQGFDQNVKTATQAMASGTKETALALVDKHDYMAYTLKADEAMECEDCKSMMVRGQEMVRYSKRWLCRDCERKAFGLIFTAKARRLPMAGEIWVSRWDKTKDKHSDRTIVSLGKDRVQYESEFIKGLEQPIEMFLQNYQPKDEVMAVD